MRTYHQFQIQNFLANMSPTDFQIPHLFSNLLCTGIKFTSMGLSFPYQFSSVVNFSSLRDYNTSISKTLFFLQFQHSLAKQIVSFHAHYIFKRFILTVQVIITYSRVQHKMKYQYLRMHPFSISVFFKCNSNSK